LGNPYLPTNGKQNLTTMKKCMIMFALLVAALLIAAWSDKNREMDTEHNIVSKSDSSTKQLLVQDNTLRTRKRK
jgi:hypothetical protein